MTYRMKLLYDHPPEKSRPFRDICRNFEKMERKPASGATQRPVFVV